MKIWSRDFTRFEKILLLVLAIVLVALAYFELVHKPVRTAIREAKAESESLEMELTIAQGTAVHLEQLSKEMDSMKAEGTASYMASYNNSKEELALLNEILADTQQYTINFADVTRSNDQIRRSFTLEFRTADYKAMQKVIRGLCDSRYRCLVGDISCSLKKEKSGESYVNAKVTATFFETMVGGTPDAGLPADKGETA